MNKVARRKMTYGTERAASSYYKSANSTWGTLGEPWPETTPRPAPVLHAVDLKCADCKGPVGFLPFRINHPETAVVHCRPCFAWRRTHSGPRPV